MKRIFFGLLIIICAALAAVWVLAKFWAPDWIKTRVVEACAQNGAGILRIDATPGVSFFPFALTFENTSWEYIGPSLKISANIRGGRVVPDVLAFLVGEFLFEEIALNAPEVAAEFLATSGTSVVGQETGAVSIPGIKRFLIQNGSLALKTPDLNAKLTAIGVSGEHPEKRGEAYVKCDFNVDAPAANLNANVALTGKLFYYAPNLSFRNAALTATFLGGAENRFSPLNLAFDGAYNVAANNLKFSSLSLGAPFGDIKLTGEISPLVPAFDGSLDVRLNPGEVAANAGELFISSPAVLEKGILTFANIAVKMGQNQGSGKLEAKFLRGKAPIVKGEFNFNRLRADFPVENAKNDAKRRPRTNGEIAFGWPELDLRLKAQALEYGKLAFGDVKLALNGKEGKYDAPLSLVWCAGKIDARGELDFARGKWNAEAKGEKIKFGEALKQFGISGFEGGAASFGVKLAASGRSATSVKASLNGAGNFEAGGVKITALRYVTDTLAFLGASRTEFTGASFSAPFAVKNGVIKFEPINAEGIGLTASGKAVANLVKDDFNGILTFRLGSLKLALALKGPFGDIAVGIDRNKSDY